MKLFICLSVVLFVACGIDGYKNPEKCDGPNEIHVDCKIPCRPTCRSILTKIPQPPCLPQEPCPPGCACRDGYVRNDDNICTKIEDCRLNAE